MVPDGLWERIEPLLPVVPRRADHPGRKRLDDRKVLCGVLFVLYTGIPWEFLPQELGFGSGMTCWRRLRDWHEAGVRQQLHELLLARTHGHAYHQERQAPPGPAAAATVAQDRDGHTATPA
jgi:transposase